MQIKHFFAAIIFFFCGYTSLAVHALAIEKNFHQIVSTTYNGDKYLLLDIKIPQDNKVYYKSYNNPELDFQIKINSQLGKDYQVIWPKPINLDGDQYYVNNISIPIKIKDQDDIINISYKFTMCGKICQFIEATQIIDLAKIHFSNRYGNTKNFIDNVYILLIAFIGGIVLNIMPCVLPVLSIKLYSIINSDTSRNARLSLIISALGIIFSFMVISLIVIFLKAGGDVLGFGLYLQNTYFITFICIMMVFLIYTANEKSKINSNNILYNKIALYKGRGIISNFIDGIITVILTTPCSTPLIGNAVAFALTQNIYFIILTFFIIGLGFAIPYIILSIFPNLLRFLPKSGKWMIVLKKAVQILLVISLIWYIYIYITQNSYIAGTLLFLICLIIKFLLEQEQKICKFLLIPAILSAFILPNATKKNFDYFNQVTNQIWRDFKPEMIRELIKQDKIVIVDITASWCPSCQINKLMVFDQPDVLKVLYNKDVLIAMRGDITTPDREIMKYINDHKRYGIPFNIIYSSQFPEGLLLKEIFDKKEFFETLQKSGYKFN